MIWNISKLYFLETIYIFDKLVKKKKKHKTSCKCQKKSKSIQKLSQDCKTLVLQPSLQSIFDLHPVQCISVFLWSFFRLSSNTDLKVKFSYQPRLLNCSVIYSFASALIFTKWIHIVIYSTSTNVSVCNIQYQHFISNQQKLCSFTGEQIMVKLDVINNSSRSVKPKFILYQKQSFIASKKRTVRTKELLKEKSDPIDPSTEQSVTKVLNIPADTCLSILNCKVLKVEYRLMVGCLWNQYS